MIAHTLHVTLADRSYPIFIGQHLDTATLLSPYLLDRQIMIVTNTTVAPLYLSTYQAAIASVAKTIRVCILPDGEQYKDFHHLHLIGLPYQ